MKRRLLYNARLLIVLIAAAISMLPIVFIITNSFMSVTEAAARYTSRVTAHNAFGVISGDMHYIDMGFLPEFITPGAWWHILVQDASYSRFLLNSFLLAVPIVLGQLVIAPMAAYAFERAKVRHKEKLFFAYIIIMLLPMQALLVPHFIAANFLGINDSYFAIILPAIFAPFGVFLIRQQMKGLSKEMLEAASMDGANEFQLFLQIVMPNIRPTLTALTVLAFAEAWSIVDQAVVFLRDPYSLPLSVYLSVGVVGDNMGVVFALSALFMVPSLILFIYGQDDIGDGAGFLGSK